MSITEPTDEMVEAAARSMWELRRRPTDPEWGSGLDLGVREEYRKDARSALRAALAVAPAPSDDDREALDAAIEPLVHPNLSVPSRVAEIRVLAAGFRRSPVSPPEDVTALLADYDEYQERQRVRAESRPGDEHSPDPLRLLDRMAAALRAPVPVETVTTEDEACARDDGTVYVDRRNDVFVKVGARAFELAGHTGRLGPTWIAYPARVFRPTREEGDRG